jgi:hypothetical protein
MSARFEMLSLAVLLAAGPLAADDSYRHGYIRTVEQGVTLQRASDATAEAAAPNVPFLPGDRVWTDDAGRMEVQFADGSTLRLDSRSKLDYVSHEGGRADRVVLRLWSGALFLHYRDGRRSPEFTIETPEGVLEPGGGGVYRLDVEPGQARAAVFEGEATVEADRRVRVNDGEQVIVREGAVYAGPEQIDSYQADDAFARWDADMERQLAYAAESQEWLPEEVSPYAGDFAAYGTWRSEPEYGYVWYPTVDVGWRPYNHGYWAWTAYGWTWVPNERWGWAAYHYGRWGFSNRGWYWIPGRSWGPAWVSWSIGNNHVGWCPLGWGDRPVHVRHGRTGGNAVRRGSGFRGEDSAPWVYVRRGDMGHRDLARRRVAAAEVPTGDLRVAPAGQARLSRDLRLVEGGLRSGALAPQRAVPRNVTRKHTPGDTVPELQADPATTIRRPIPRRHRQPDEEREPAAAEPSSRNMGVRRPQGAPPTAWSTDAKAAPREEAAPRSDERTWRDRIQPRRAPGAEPRVEPREAPRARPAEPRAGRDRDDRDREILRPIFGPLSRPRGDDDEARSRDAAPRREGRPSRPERTRDSSPQSERSRPSGVSSAPRAPAPPPPAARPEGRGKSGGGERARPKERN